MDLAWHATTPRRAVMALHAAIEDRFVVRKATLVVKIRVVKTQTKRVAMIQSTAVCVASPNGPFVAFRNLSTTCHLAAAPAGLYAAILANTAAVILTQDCRCYAAACLTMVFPLQMMQRSLRRSLGLLEMHSR